MVEPIWLQFGPPYSVIFFVRVRFLGAWAAREAFFFIPFFPESPQPTVSCSVAELRLDLVETTSVISDLREQFVLVLIFFLWCSIVSHRRSIGSGKPGMFGSSIAGCPPLLPAFFSAVGRNVCRFASPL